MKAADLRVRCMEHEGVRGIVGLPGEETLELTEARRDSRIRLVPARHGQGAAFTAEVWCRLSGQVERAEIHGEFR